MVGERQEMRRVRGEERGEKVEKEIERRVLVLEFVATAPAQSRALTILWCLADTGCTTGLLESRMRKEIQNDSQAVVAAEQLAVCTFGNT